MLRRLLFALTVALLLFTAASHAGDKGDDWALMIQAGVNDESNLESRAFFRFERFTVDVRGREADLIELPLHTSRFTLNTQTKTKLTWDVELAYLIGKKAMHGPVINYTDRGNDDETVFAGWRLWVKGGQKHQGYGYRP